MLFTMSEGFCQMTETIREKGRYEVNENHQKYRILYFHELTIDASIFQQDSVVLYENKIQPVNPRIELYDDAKFCLLYNIKFETITQRDERTGDWTQKVIQTSDKITGDYGAIQISGIGENKLPLYSAMTLRFADGNTIKYSIVKGDSQLILIKKE